MSSIAWSSLARSYWKLVLAQVLEFLGERVARRRFRGGALEPGRQALLEVGDVVAVGRLPAQRRAQVEGVPGLRISRQHPVEVSFGIVELAAEELGDGQVVEQRRRVAEQGAGPFVVRDRRARVVAAVGDGAGAPAGPAVTGKFGRRLGDQRDRGSALAHLLQQLGLLDLQGAVAVAGLQRGVEVRQGGVRVAVGERRLGGEHQHLHARGEGIEQPARHLQRVRGPAVGDHRVTGADRLYGLRDGIDGRPGGCCAHVVPLCGVGCRLS
jgi:hypothetical protein